MIKRNENPLIKLYKDLFLGAKHLNIAEEIAKINNKKKIVVIIKMLFAKIWYGFATTEYALYDLERIPVKFWKKFLSIRSLRHVQIKLNPPDLGFLIDNKIEYYIRCLQHGLRSPKIWAIICGNSHRIGQIPQGTRVITDKKQLFNFMQSQEEHQDLIIKPAKGLGGEGLISLIINPDGVFDALDRLIPIEEIYHHCFLEYQNEPFIVQERLKPHPDLKSLMPGRSLGCFRINTYFSEPKPSVLFVFIKIPARNNITDTFHSGTTGNLIAQVDITTGKIGKAWGKRPDKDTIFLSEYTAHPTTGVALKGFRIPQWDAILKTAIRGAQAFPEFKIIGWDVALSENGIFLIEANRRWDADAPQIVLERAFRKEMMALV